MSDGGVRPARSGKVARTPPVGEPPGSELQTHLSDELIDVAHEGHNLHYPTLIPCTHCPATQVSPGLQQPHPHGATSGLQMIWRHWPLLQI